MKKIILSVLAMSTLMIACKDNDKENNLDENYDTSTEQTMADNEDQEYASSITRQEAEEMSQQWRDNVTVDENNQVNVKNFAAYGELQNSIRNLSVDPEVRNEMLGKNAYTAFEHFVDEMPAYLKTTYVMKEVEDVREAMDQYQYDMNHSEVSEELVKNHIMDLKEAVDDLDNEITDVRQSLDTSVEINYADYQEFTNNVNYNDEEGMIVITDYPIYTTVYNDWTSMSEASYNEQLTEVEKLNKDFQQMINTMPAYLKIDDVMDAVEDVQKEMNEYQEDKQKGVDQDEMEENLEEIDEALYDLDKEFKKARKKYAEDRKDATEEFMEEFTSDSDQTIRERVRDASEEYEEEMGS
ncbi:hypothetical protein [Nonlabens xiamenensis]|uniref:hypothetical protein n=1 Tax=Nonlabens xiamenensis TaxID=2341043 RepID=UPI000F607FA4|nr:hypothetical protein [Nonlabens xiamenensis]